MTGIRQEAVNLGIARDFAQMREDAAGWIKAWRESLADDDVRQAAVEYDRLRRRNNRRGPRQRRQAMAPEILLMHAEYERRLKDGTLKRLTPQDRVQRRLARSEDARWLAELSDEEVREGCRIMSRLRRQGIAAADMPEDVQLKFREYRRRAGNGSLVRLPPGEAYERRMRAWKYAPTSESQSWTDEEVRAAGNEYERLRRHGEPIPEKLRCMAQERNHRYRTGALPLRTASERDRLQEAAAARGSVRTR